MTMLLTFRDPPDEHELEKRWKTLKKGNGAPGPMVVGLGCAPCNPRNKESTQVPETVVDSSEDTTMLGMANLGEKNRRAHLSERVTET